MDYMLFCDGLFSLSSDQQGLVGEFGKRVGEEWNWEFRWRRDLREREIGMVNNMLLVISTLAPRAGKKDGWKWKAAKDGVFSTKSAYEAISKEKGEMASTHHEVLAQVWEAPTPHKARVVAWRSLRNRLATCDNLVKTNVPIKVEEKWCNACVCHEETVEHMFLHCPKAEQIWDQIQQWLNIKTAKPQGLSQHFLSFTHGGKGKKSRKFLKALWVGTIWLLWNYRNESRFEGKACDTQKLVLDVKGRLWSWNKTFQIVEVNVPFSLWCSREYSLSFL
ncbi:uncharacterized protein LOC131026163 [Salvia miltiorrhiza]|uniref:uncharacterized protein LOC131026163 n=1 Tax=Salvia miltiorrhiza TaxID=226208 RepID=UPI0025ABC23F|nr:uncharacterized protein LOC131026163 [Salvia miltiorrhiza]